MRKLLFVFFLLVSIGFILCNTIFSETSFVNFAFVIPFFFLVFLFLVERDFSIFLVLCFAGFYLFHGQLNLSLFFLFVFSIYFYALFFLSSCIGSVQIEKKFQFGVGDLLLSLYLLISLFLPFHSYYFCFGFVGFFTSYSIFSRLFLSVILTRLNCMGIVVSYIPDFLNLSRVSNIVFSKTGVLTLGELSVTSVVCDDVDLFQKYLVYGEYGLVGRVSKAILEEYPDVEVDLKKRHHYQVSDFGISYIFNRRKILVGSATFLLEHGVLVPDVDESGTIVYVSESKRVLGYVILSDKLSLQNEQVIQNLYRLGISHMSVFSRDQMKVTMLVSRTLGIYDSYGELSTDKRNFWFYHLKRIYAGETVYISDAVSDLEVLCQIIFSDTESTSDHGIIRLKNGNLKQCYLLFRYSFLYQKLMFMFLILTIVTKMLFLGISLLWIFQTWFLLVIGLLLLLLEAIGGIVLIVWKNGRMSE
ncbi:MAG: hypothetical protein PUB18_01055 [bacterium]|nr:hypothetical protein [bacterium]